MSEKIPSFKAFWHWLRTEFPEYMLPVDVQGAVIMMPVDIQGQAIDLIVIPKTEEGNGSETGIDTEVSVLTITTLHHKNLGLALKNTGANDLTYSIVGYYNQNGTITEDISIDVSLPANSSAFEKLDVSKYAKIEIKAMASISGNPSDLNWEYILKA